MTFGCAVNHLPLLLQQKRENLSPLCLIPMVTSPQEEQQLLASTSKVRPLSPAGWRLGASPCSLTPTLVHPLSPNSPWWSSCTTAVTTSTPIPGDHHGDGRCPGWNPGLSQPCFWPMGRAVAIKRDEKNAWLDVNSSSAIYPLGISDRSFLLLSFNFIISKLGSKVRIRW